MISVVARISPSEIDRYNVNGLFDVTYARIASSILDRLDDLRVRIAADDYRIGGPFKARLEAARRASDEVFVESEADNKVHRGEGSIHHRAARAGAGRRGDEHRHVAGRRSVRRGRTRRSRPDEVVAGAVEGKRKGVAAVRSALVRAGPCARWHAPADKAVSARLGDEPERLKVLSDSVSFVC
jgi:hypothetical protein